MLSRGRLLFIFVSLSVVVALVGGSLWAATARDQDDGSDSLYKYLSMFVDVLDLVKRAYVDESDPQVLMSGAFDGATDALDPFSMYIPAGAVDRYLESQTIGAQRSGLVVLKERGVAYAMAVMEDSPAAQAGLERGDLLATIQGRSTRKIPLWEIQTILAGTVGTEIAVKRIRLGEQADVSFALAEFPLPGVVLETRRGVAVLRLESIGADTPSNVAASLATLRGGGTAVLPGLREPGKLILDLRDLAGGEGEIAYQVASLFIAGELGALVDREDALEVFTSDDAPRFGGEVVVLINRGTMGAAEIVATVLQQSAGASVVGERSFGHSGRQSLVELSNGDRLQITTAFYAGADRAPINTSLQPDVVVRPRGFGLEAEETDAILDRALDVILGADEPELEKAA